MGRVEIDQAAVGAVMRSAYVRAALRARAQAIANAARAIESSEGGRATIEAGEGTRPQGRPYGRVTSDGVDGEWGTSKTERRRTLGRAAETR